MKYLGTDRTFCKLINIIYDKPINNSILNKRNLRPFLVKCGIKRYLHFLFILKTASEILARAVRQKKDIPGIKNKEGRNQINCFKLTFYNLIFSIKSPFRVYQKPQLIRIFSKLQHTNPHTKAVTFLHSSNEITEKELGKNSLFTVAPGAGVGGELYPAINLSKDMDDFYKRSLRH